MTDENLHPRVAEIIDTLETAQRDFVELMESIDEEQRVKTDLGLVGLQQLDVEDFSFGDEILLATCCDYGFFHIWTTIAKFLTSVKGQGSEVRPPVPEDGPLELSLGETDLKRFTLDFCFSGKLVLWRIYEPRGKRFACNL